MPETFTIDSNVAEVLNLMEKASEAALTVVGGKIQDKAKHYLKPKGPKGGAWPGREATALRDSIKFMIENGILYVGSNRQDAPYIELGTGKGYDPPPEWLQYHGEDKHSKAGLDHWIYFDQNERAFKIGLPITAQPYLRPSFLNHIDEYKHVLMAELENAPG